MKKLKINDTIKPYLKNVTTFRFLSDNELDELLEAGEILQYQDEESIIQQGNFDQTLYAVLQGSVKVTVNNNNNTSYICTLGSSEIFGEAGIFMNVERTANVISMDEAVLFKINRKEMLSFVNKHPNASNKIFMVMIYSMLQKLKEANRELAYERKSDCNQEDIDSLINNLIST